MPNQLTAIPASPLPAIDPRLLFVRKITAQVNPRTYTPALLGEYADMMNRHLNNPTIWSIPEVMQACKRTMVNNLTIPFAYVNSQAMIRVKHKQEFKLFGNLFAQALKDEDCDPVIDALQDDTYRHVRSKGDGNWVELIEDKFNTNDICQCNDCNTVDYDTNGGTAYDDYWVCQSCLDDSYVYSDNRDTYITQDDYDEEQEEEERERDDEDSHIIGGRHDNKNVLGHIPSAFDSRKPSVLMGMELEVEVGSDHSRSDKAEELYDEIKWAGSKQEHQYIFIEDDGSLSHGFEIVTGYTGLDVHADMLKFFKKPWRGMRSHDTKTCGLHVHIDKKDVSLFHACKMVFFINDSNNQKLIRDIARRSNHYYAKIGNKKASYQWLKDARGYDNPLNRLNDDRTEALNFQNPNTIEFRLFKGTLRYETIMACLEFTYATWFFCRDTGVSELTSAKFIEFICQPNQRKDTKYLRTYLKEKGYSLPKPAVMKDNPRNSDAPAQPIETAS